MNDTEDLPRGAPIVSVIMANWRGERYLAEAMASVLAQTMDRLELLVADDASDDRSQEIVREVAERDPRVRLLPATSNSGPSDARNRAIEQAKGEWIAILDSDDLVHPRRLELLLDAARRSGADLVADDMAFFGSTPDTAGRTLLKPLGLTDLFTVQPAFFVESDTDSRLPNLGYLKPLIRRSAVAGTRYDPTVRVGEDFDFYLRLLLKGCRFVLVPLPLYLYRRHSASLSHRLSIGALRPLLAAHDALVAGLSDRDPDLAQVLATRGRTLRRALRYEELVSAIKSGARSRAIRMVMSEPGLVRPLARSIRERLARRQRRLDAPTATRVALVPKSATDSAALSQTAEAPDLTIEVPRISLEELHLAPDLTALSCQLTELAAQGTVDIVAFGPEGLDALGLLPGWRSAEVWLTSEDEAANLQQLPPNARLKRVPATSSSAKQAAD